MSHFAVCSNCNRLFYVISVRHVLLLQHGDHCDGCDYISCHCQPEQRLWWQACLQVSAVCKYCLIFHGNFVWGTMMQYDTLFTCFTFSLPGDACTIQNAIHPHRVTPLVLLPRQGWRHTQHRIILLFPSTPVLHLLSPLLPTHCSVHTRTQWTRQC